MSSSHTSTSPANKLISFYDPQISAPDHAGRTLNTILAWSDTNLERSHNYIQVIFPLPEGSPYNTQAPLITEEVFRAFRERIELRSQLKRSFTRICRFYGFDMATGEGEGDGVVNLTIAEHHEVRFL